MRTGLRRRGAARPSAVLLAAVLSAALSLSACTGEPPPAGPPAPAGVLVGAAASQSRAAELQAGLTHLLVERVYVTAAAGRTGAPEPSLADARDVLDDNSRALAQVLGATYLDARSPLLGALRGCDKAQLGYAAALTSGDPAAVAMARAALEQASDQLGSVVRRVVAGMAVEQVSVRLREDLEAQLVAQSGPPYTALRTAAGRAIDTASLLAAEVAADRRLGPAGTRAATLRAQLTGLLTEHVLLVGGLASELMTGGDGPTGERASGARAALEGNARDLSQTLGGAYPDAAQPFLSAWNDHLVQLEVYAAAVAATGRAPSGQLRTAPQTFGRLLARHIAGPSAGRIASDLTPGLDTLLSAVDAAATGAPRSASALHRATADAPPPAAALAAATAEHLRLR